MLLALRRQRFTGRREQTGLGGEGVSTVRLQVVALGARGTMCPEPEARRQRTTGGGFGREDSGEQRRVGGVFCYLLLKFCRTP